MLGEIKNREEGGQQTGRFICGGETRDGPLGDRRIAERTLQGTLKNRIHKKGGDSHMVQRPAQG